MPNRRKISFVLNFFLQVSVKRLVMFSLLGLILTLFRTQCQFGMPNRGTHLELLCNFRFRRSVALVFFFFIVLAHKSTWPDHNIFFRFCKYYAVLWNSSLLHRENFLTIWPFSFIKFCSMIMT
jgi:hypothetical protein